MDLKQAVRAGMRVVGPDDRAYGTIDRHDDAAIYVQGRRVPFAAIERVEQDRLYVGTPDLWRLTDSEMTSSAGTRLDAPAAEATAANLGGETRIPVLEEHLAFATREIDLGEIRVHKSVEEAEEARSGVLRREDVEVQRIRVDRRVAEPEQSRQEGDWLIIPVMEEVFVVEKRLMVTEEIRIRKHLVTEEAEVRDTVRRERVAVEDTRVPRDRLLTEPVMPGTAREPRRRPGDRPRRDPLDAETAQDGARPDDPAWQRLHEQIRDA